MIKLHHGDCLAVMASIPDKSIDMVLCDPPYNTTSNKWDRLIPFDAMWAELKRIIKPNKAILLFSSEPFATRLKMSNIDDYKYDWYWVKNNVTGFVHAKNMPLKNIELINVFSTGAINHEGVSKKRMPYNPQGLLPVNVVRKNSKNKSGGLMSKRPSHKAEYEQNFTNYPRMTLEFNKDPVSLHPTQKPVALLEYLIKTYTSEGETVLDFTMGSGSTGIACLNTNRQFTGIELDKHYFDVATKRINEHSGLA